MKPYPLLIGGVFKETNEIVKVRFPYTGDVYAEVCQAGNAELEEAVAACFFYSNGKNQFRKTANDKMASDGAEMKRTTLYCN